MIRGRRTRLGFHGVDGLPLFRFCDLVWAEIWDDCPPMGDHAQYHEIVTKLFIKCEDPAAITYKDHEGKVKRLGEGGSVSGASQSLKDEVDAMYEQARLLREAKADV